MARRPKLIAAPSGRGGSIENGWRLQSGSMGALMPDGGVIGSIPGQAPPPEHFEAPELDASEIRRREMELGLEPDRPTAAAYEPYYTPVVHPPTLPTPVLQADLSGLPPSFTMTFEQKGDVWKITAPAVHIGLWKAGHDLSATIQEALSTLAQMVRVDGIVARPKRKSHNAR